MKKLYKTNTGCRICKSEKLTKILKLGPQPLANGFRKKSDLDKEELFFPLDIYFCHNCNLVQLIDVVDKSVLYRDYVYFTSGMPKASDHFLKYAQQVIKNYLTKKNDLVVEIASNDGILLKLFQDEGYKVLGVEPALNIVKVARKNGVTTIPEFFSEKIANKVVKKYGKAKAILANNVVAHINDHHDLAMGVKTLLSEDGVFVIEAPYLVDMFENLSFDTIYHEHLSYLAIRPLTELFKQFCLEIFDVNIIPVQGQSLRVFVGHQGKHKIKKIVFDLVQKELDYKMDKLTSYLKLGKRIEKSKKRLLATLKDLKRKSKKISAYGAPAKGNTLLNYYKIGTSFLDFALEDLPSKHGLYTPGMHIPVMDREYARTHLPDYYLLLAWNYINPILEKEKEYRKNGGKFIIPIGDEIKVV